MGLCSNKTLNTRKKEHEGVGVLGYQKDHGFYYEMGSYWALGQKKKSNIISIKSIIIKKDDFSYYVKSPVPLSSVAQSCPFFVTP